MFERINGCACNVRLAVQVTTLGSHIVSLNTVLADNPSRFSNRTSKVAPELRHA